MEDYPIDLEAERQIRQDNWLPLDDLPEISNNGRKLKEIAETDCPALPEAVGVDFEQGRGAGYLLDLYTSYAASIAPMTPLVFHDSAILWLVAVAIARRLVVDVGFGSIYPNLYIIWLARTTLFTKSTALKVAWSVAWSLFPHLLASQDQTPEAFLSDLCGREPSNLETLSEAQRSRWLAKRNFAAQQGQILDEVSGLLAGAGRDYNAGLLEIYLRLHDCLPISRSTRSQGWLAAEYTYLSLLSASTPAAMAQHLLSERLWQMGWWRRHAILTPEAEHPEWQEPKPVPEPRELLEGLQHIYQRLPQPKWPEPPEARAVGFEDGARNLWRRYNKALRNDLLRADNGLDSRLEGTYGALPVQALKVAMILSAMDWPDEWAAPTIEISHMTRAIEIAEEWRVSVHRALTIAGQSQGDNIRKRIIRQLGRAGSEGATRRDLSRNLKDTRPEAILSALEALVQVGEVETRDHEGMGPRTQRYRLVRD